MKRLNLLVILCLICLITFSFAGSFTAPSFKDQPLKISTETGFLYYGNSSATAKASTTGAFNSNVVSYYNFDETMNNFTNKWYDEILQNICEEQGEVGCYV
jgi:hypothetical protein